MDKWEAKLKEIKKASRDLEDLQDDYSRAKNQMEAQFERAEDFKRGLQSRLEENHDAVLSDLRYYADKGNPAYEEGFFRARMIFQDCWEASEAVYRQHVYELEGKFDEMDYSYRRQINAQADTVDRLRRELRQIDEEGSKRR